ncbi:hypothetical protein C8R44DRAFT_891783 [Mycena epipterygia]|nr:hypothetical protein C8R44DRAFT_891783 [Mycena epipterygia]
MSGPYLGSSSTGTGSDYPLDPMQHQGYQSIGYHHQHVDQQYHHGQQPAMNQQVNQHHPGQQQPTMNQYASPNTQSHPPHPLADRQPILNEPVITRMQNYPPMFTDLQNLQNTISRLEVQVAAANRVAEAAKESAHMAREAQDTVSRKSELKTAAKKSRVQALTQNKMRWLLGTGGRDIGGKAIDVLPCPLKPGEEAELLEDGKTKKAHPIWHEGVLNLDNLHFCMQVKDLVMEHVERDNRTGALLLGDPSDADVLKAAKVFFRTLRKKYSAQTTDEGRARNNQKLKVNKHRSRKHEKADDHRLAIPRFREIHGEDNTVGDYELVLTDDMSSERSDCGNVSKSTFNAHRKAAGGGEYGWEVRKKPWRSSWFELYLAHLKTIRRDMLTERTELGASGSIGGKHRVPRFKGLPENINHSAPGLLRRKPLYKSMVSRTWMEKTTKKYEEIGALSDPLNFTIFKLKLDTTGLHDTEMEYLADDEA